MNGVRIIFTSWKSCWIFLLFSYLLLVLQALPCFSRFCFLPQAGWFFGLAHWSSDRPLRVPKSIARGCPCSATVYCSSSCLLQRSCLSGCLPFTDRFRIRRNLWECWFGDCWWSDGRWRVRIRTHFTHCFTATNAENDCGEECCGCLLLRGRLLVSCRRKL